MAVHISVPMTSAQPVDQRTALFSASREGSAVTLLDFLRMYPDEPRIYWRAEGERAAYAGVGAAAVLTAEGENRFESIRQQSRRLFENVIRSHSTVPGIQPRIFGGFSYLPARDTAGVWAEFPSALFILPRYVLTDIGGRRWLTVNHLASQDDAASVLETLVYRLDLLSASQPARNGHTRRAAPEIGTTYLTDCSQWASMVTQATGQIMRGELQKVVLARAAEVSASHPIDPLAALSALGERYSACHRFLIEPVPGHAFFGATPELLAQIDGRQISTTALAGSTRRGDTSEEDAALGRALLANPKERHEHALVVDSIRDSLAALTGDLRIESEPSLRHLHNIQHLRTGIEGTLSSGVDALAVVEALHPTPALGGAPRDAALDLIARLEAQGRGWYGAPVGWLDSEGNGTFVVAIRSAVSAGNTARLYAGAGIVADSHPDSEWQETALKLRPLLEALSVSTGSPSLKSERRAGGEVA